MVPPSSGAAPDRISPAIRSARRPDDLNGVCPQPVLQHLHPERGAGQAKLGDMKVRKHAIAVGAAFGPGNQPQLLVKPDRIGMDSDYLRHLGRPVRFHLSDTSCFPYHTTGYKVCLLYTSDAADEL